MPTVLRVGRYRFFFFSNEGTEPRHIHVESGEQYAKFWLDPVRLEKSSSYNTRELSEIERIVAKNKHQIREKWDEHFGR